MRHGTVLDATVVTGQDDGGISHVVGSDLVFMVFHHGQRGRGPGSPLKQALVGIFDRVQDMTSSADSGAGGRHVFQQLLNRHPGRFIARGRAAHTIGHGQHTMHVGQLDQAGRILIRG